MVQSRRMTVGELSGGVGVIRYRERMKCAAE